MKKLKGLSLFANVGVAESYFDEIGIEVAIANEIDEKRSKFYKHLYPDCDMVTGDIKDIEIQSTIIKKSEEAKIDFVMATPPCQGMSLAGKRDKYDPRNQLITYAVDIIKKIKPKYVFLENVPQQQKTKIKYFNEIIIIPDYLKFELESIYNFNQENLIKCMDYSIPQMRKRNIYLLTRKDLNISWEFPDKEKIITLEKAISHLPSVAPYVRGSYEKTIELFPDFEELKKNAEQISPFHTPPTHAERHIRWMIHTPTGETAFNNEFHYPQKKDGSLIKGHYNNYRRHVWNKPCRTIIMNNGVISSLCCVHPGRFLKFDNDKKTPIYSDPRVLTLYELFIVSSIPLNWNVPSWANDNFLRRVVGEGIPPLLVKKIMLNLLTNT